MNNMPKDFLNEEIRCDYVVSSKMKAVWKVELDILEEILRICKKFDLKVMMAGGTILGAIRHKGFVPWDDDIDVMMPRKDYDVFLEVAQAELPGHLFLRTKLTDKGMLASAARVSDSRTCAVENDYVNYGIVSHMGIFVDVFPLDRIGSDERRFRRQLRISRIINSIRRRSACRKRDGVLDIVKWVVASSFRCLIGDERLFEWERKVFEVNGDDRGQWLCMAPSTWSNWKRWLVKDSWIRTTIMVDFEYLKVPIPVESEKILEQTYGDWRKPVRGGAMHGGLRFDVDRTYKDVLVSEYGYKENDFLMLP